MKKKRKCILHKYKKQQDKKLTDIFSKFIKIVKIEKKFSTKEEHNLNKEKLKEIKFQFQNLNLEKINLTMLDKEIPELNINDFKNIFINVDLKNKNN